jgi:hypothetical protein
VELEERSMIVAGIDVGLSGGIAVINELGDCDSIMTPVIDGIVDSVALSRFLAEREVEFVVIEATHSMPRQGVKSTFSFGHSSGQVRAIGQLICIEPRMIRPQEWKSAWGLIKKDKTASRQLAAKVFPRAAEQFKRVKDDGRAEAALLAGYHLNMHMKVAA